LGMVVEGDLQRAEKIHDQSYGHSGFQVRVYECGDKYAFFVGNNEGFFLNRSLVSQMSKYSPKVFERIYRGGEGSVLGRVPGGVSSESLVAVVRAVEINRHKKELLELSRRIGEMGKISTGI